MDFWKIPLYFTSFWLKSFRRNRLVFKLGVCFYFNCKCFHLVCKDPWASTEWLTGFVCLKHLKLTQRCKSAVCVLSHSVVSDCLRRHGCQASLSVVFPRQNTGMGCRFLLQGVFPTQRSNHHLLCILHWHVETLSTQRKFSLQILKSFWYLKTLRYTCRLRKLKLPSLDTLLIAL